MAESRSKRKVRVRKSAPTIRQAQEDAVKAGAEAPSKLPKASKLSFGLSLPQNKVTSGLKSALAKITPRYFANSWREVRQVTWPSRRETWRLTLAVFIFAIIFGALVAGVDKGLDAIFKHTVLK